MVKCIQVIEPDYNDGYFDCIDGFKNYIDYQLISCFHRYNALSLKFCFRSFSVITAQTEEQLAMLLFKNNSPENKLLMWETMEI